MQARLLLVGLAVALSGCFSTMGHLSGERCVYHGTRLSWAWANDPKPLAGWPFLIDTPFSIVLDTVLLPYDLTAFLPEGMGGGRQDCVMRGVKVM
ncbi:YceK/YidQ family lipoprotein [Pseudomonas sp.]|uniref:YceK/YidQ family lipoprotein n=1 Tax=Pseudomonas sp. TaxID=306 RepID=UPI0028AE2133|nr:YceK/YidQ family lipoprotein [Pseudomonas sp.]